MRRGQEPRRETWLPEFDPRQIVILDQAAPAGGAPGWIVLTTRPELVGTLQPFGSVYYMGQDAAGEYVYRLVVSRRHDFWAVWWVLVGLNITHQLDWHYLEAGRLIYRAEMYREEPLAGLPGWLQDPVLLIGGLIGIGLVMMILLLLAAVF